jgi:hypothetical protein
MTDAFKKEIHNFDNGRATLAWDGLVSRQQHELERMRVPAMFHSTIAKDREVSMKPYADVSDSFICETAPAASYPGIRNYCRFENHIVELRFEFV